MSIRRITALVAPACLAFPAIANPVQGFYVDLPNCDDHGFRVAREELGTGPAFPMDELIDATFTFTADSACPLSDDTAMPNALVVMTNLSGRDWTDLFYVADPDTMFSNFDGEAESATVPGLRGRAMRIDAIGSNRPLMFESFATNGVFEAGETWSFILQDFTDLFGLGPAAMSSLDFAGGSHLSFDSTGSIVQFVPTPGSLGVLACAGVLGLRRRRG